jgi:hypothetical protein
MCASTRFSIALPLRNIQAKTILKALIILVLLWWVFLKQLSQSTMTQLKEYSKAGTGRSGATRKF